MSAFQMMVDPCYRAARRIVLESKVSDAHRHALAALIARGWSRHAELRAKRTGRTRRFRISKQQGDAAKRTARFLARAEAHAQTHPNDTVRKASLKLLRGLDNVRIGPEELDLALARLRKLLQRVGRRAADHASVLPFRRIQVDAALAWETVCSKRQLREVGRALDNCIGAPGQHQRHYCKSLAERDSDFWVLMEEGQPVALALAAGANVLQAEARSGGTLDRHRKAWCTLIQQAQLQPGTTFALSSAGVTPEFMDVDEAQPDAVIAGCAVWKGCEQRLLVQVEGAWAVVETYDEAEPTSPEALSFRLLTAALHSEIG